MADILYDSLIAPSAARPRPDPATLSFLAHLAAQPPHAVVPSEPQQLAQASHSLSISLQALSKRSHRAVISSANRHKSLRNALPIFSHNAINLRNAIPKLDAEALHFATTFSKAGDNVLLTQRITQRKKALLLVRNVDRLVDVLELPTLLTTAISSAPPNYPSAIDLSSHIRRLHSLYPSSPITGAVLSQAEQVTHHMAADLITSLKAPSLKLAVSIRTIGWLRRIVADMIQETWTSQGLPDRGLGLIFLSCRLTTLVATLEALQPLRTLADDEKAKQESDRGNSHSWSGGQQTERYLKRYVEIFREQSFGIVSMHRSLFTSTSPVKHAAGIDDPLQPIPAPLTSFPLHLVDMLLATLDGYMPCIREQAARDSILNQVLYCAGSLGRLGGDFGVMLGGVCLNEQGGEAEWVDIVKRHRLLAGRLESVIGDRKGHSPKAT